MKQLTIKARDIEKLISSALKDMFSQDGFDYKKTFNQFERKKGDYTSIFNILITSWSSCYSIDVRLYLSQKQVENIYESIFGRSHRLTIGNTIDRIYASPDGIEIRNGNLTINIYFDEDVEAAIESLEKYYYTIAKHYFEKYQDLKAIDNIINNPPFDHNPADVGGMFTDRCIKGLIIARLVNNPNYEQLAVTYDESIKGTMDAKLIGDYFKAREYLMYNPVKS